MSKNSFDSENASDCGTLPDPQAQVVDDCLHCPYIGPKWDGDAFEIVYSAYQAFHQPCRNSLCVESPAIDVTVCDACRHLRLWHLVSCMGAKDFSVIEVYVAVDVTLAQFMARECSFCQVIKDLFVSNAHEPTPRRGEDGPAIFSILIEVHDLIQEKDFHTAVKVYSGKGMDRRSYGLGSVQILPLDNSKASLILAKRATLNQSDQLRPLVNENVSWSRIKTMLDTCAQQHLDCQVKSETLLPVGFRVIDIVKRCIVDGSGVLYVALSYVWGMDVYHSTIALHSTLESLKVEGSLSKGRMPQTLEDAMQVCESLNERYLWVDRVCIVQDDVEDQARQFQAMNVVYSKAEFVIIARYGDGGSFGIPGIGFARPSAQQVYHTRGLRVVNHIQYKLNDELHIWNT